VWEGFDRAERFRPSPIQEQLVEAERLGRKSGRGFYRYANGQKTDPDLDAVNDSAGDPAAIAGRIELAILAEAWRALGDGIATAADIDLAMRLGAGHRVGPFERTMELGGPAALVAAIDAIPRPGPRFEMPPVLLETVATARPSRG
jgi:3-hydroxybutyryl-CoA dehydrogenase